MKKTTINIPVIIGAIICLTICIINVQNKLAVSVCGMGIGMQVMLLIDTIKDKIEKK